MKVSPTTPAITWLNDRNLEKVLVLKPPYQRKPVWTESQKAYLIDTILNDFLIPEIFIHRITDYNGKTIYNIVDGQQRIRSVLDFINGIFSLSGEFTPQFADYKFSDLPNQTKQKIWDYTMNAREITNASEDEVRNIFRRMNKNVVALNPQELRHSTYWGDFIKLMEEIAEDEFWAESKIVNPKEIRRMTDVQFISDLFISMMNGIQDKTKEMDTYYEMYEKDFPEKNKWFQRFILLIKNIRTIFPHIGETRWKNKSDFYSLFMVLNELTSDQKPLVFNTVTLRKELLTFSTKISAASLKENKGKKLSKKIASYVNAVTKSTTDKDRRVIRHNILLPLVKKHLKK